MSPLVSYVLPKRFDAPVDREFPAAVAALRGRRKHFDNQNGRREDGLSCAELALAGHEHVGVQDRIAPSEPSYIR